MDDEQPANWRDNKRLGQFIDAAVNDQPSAKEMLEQHPELIDDRYLWGETALHFLAVENYVDGVRFLISLGFDVNATNESGETPLGGAVQLGYEEMATLLLDAGADPNVGTLFHSKIIFGTIREPDLIMLELLLRHGVHYDAAELAADIDWPLPPEPEDIERVGAILRRYGHDLPEPPYFCPEPS